MLPVYPPASLPAYHYLWYTERSKFHDRGTTMETITELPLLAAQSDVRSPRERQAATRAVLDSFMEQEEDEHRDTLRVLRQALGTAYAATDSFSH